MRVKLLLLTVLTLVGFQPAFGQLACEPLFLVNRIDTSHFISRSKQNIKIYEQVSMILERVRSSSVKDPNLVNIPEFLPQAKWMHNELSRFLGDLSKYDHLATSSEYNYREAHKLLIKNLDFLKTLEKNLARQVETQTFLYGPFINLSYDFARAMNMQSTLEIASQKGYIHLVLMSEDANIREKLRIVIRRFPSAILVPQMENLDLPDFIHSAIHGEIFFIGLSNRPIAFDGRKVPFENTYPSEFLDHDLNHYFQITSAQRGLTKNQETLDFLREISLKLSKTNDPILTRTVEHVLFEHFHENGSFLTKYLMANSFQHHRVVYKRDLYRKITSNFYLESSIITEKEIDRAIDLILSH